MNWDRVEGNWKQLKGKVQAQWGQLSDDDLDEAEKQVDKWQSSWKDDWFR